MSQTRKEMSDIKHLLRLHQQGKSNREIGRLLAIHRNTVNSYIQLFKSSGHSIESLLGMSEGALHQVMEPRGQPEDPNARQAVFRSLLPSLETEMGKTGATLEAIWERVYRPQGGKYSYTHFTRLMRAERKKTEVGARWEHPLGEKLFVDFSGKKLPLTDAQSGEVKWMEVFVAVLGASQYTYVEAVESQSLPHFLEVVQNALHYFGGVPRAIVPDNLKAAVNKADRYEPQINRNFEALSGHYGTVILPTRAYRPRDKSLVEGAVKLVYQQIFYPLADQVFYRLTELNAAIGSLLTPYNDRPMQHHGQSRSERFEEEKPALNPLPTHRYEHHDYRRGEVNKDAHLWYGPDKHYYSVPYRYAARSVFVLATTHTLEIYLAANHERIAVHSRSGKVGGFSTQAEHMPPHVRFVHDWSLESLEPRAASIGPHTLAFFRLVFQHKTLPEQAFKTCSGILHLQKAFPPERIETACLRARLFENFHYQTVKNILQKGLDLLDAYPGSARSDHEVDSPPPIPLDHPNIRGADYFS